MPKINAATLEAHRSETTDRLLDAWGELVMEHGYDGVSLADVSRRAGLARTAIYNYFADREALLFAWTDREVQRTVDALRERIGELDDANEQLRAFVHIELESFTTSHLPPGREVVHILGHDSYRRFMSHIEPVESILRGILETGLEQGVFADDLDVDETLPLVLAAIGAERAPLSTGEHALDEASTRVSSFLVRALGATSTRRSRRGRR